MKQSQLGANDLLAHLHVVSDYADEADVAFAESCLGAARSYVRTHCNVTDDYMDSHDDIAIAVLVIAGDMYDNRGMYVGDDAPNRTVEAILGHHDRNMVEGEVEQDALV